MTDISSNKANGLIWINVYHRANTVFLSFFCQTGVKRCLI